MSEGPKWYLDRYRKAAAAKGYTPQWTHVDEDDKEEART